MTALAGGKLIKVAGAFGVDYAFLATAPEAVAAEGVSIHGTAAAVQDRGAVSILSLSAPGEVHYKRYGVAGAGGVSLRVDKQGLLVNVAPSGQAQTVELTAPGQWSVSGAKPKYVRDGEIELSLPAGASSVRLTGR